MRTWALQDAKARFSELVDAAVRDGPQLVTRRGVETAVLVPMSVWDGLQARGRRTLKDLLLSDTDRCDLVLPDRGGWTRREPLSE